MQLQDSGGTIINIATSARSALLQAPRPTARPRRLVDLLHLAAGHGMDTAVSRGGRDSRIDGSRTAHLHYGDAAGIARSGTHHSAGRAWRCPEDIADACLYLASPLAAMFRARPSRCMAGVRPRRLPGRIKRRLKRSRRTACRCRALLAGGRRAFFSSRRALPDAAAGLRSTAGTPTALASALTCLLNASSLSCTGSSSPIFSRTLPKSSSSTERVLLPAASVMRSRAPLDGPWPR